MEVSVETSPLKIKICLVSASGLSKVATRRLIWVHVAGSHWWCNVIEVYVGQVQIVRCARAKLNPAALAVGIFIQEVTVSFRVYWWHFVVEGSFGKVETSLDVGHLQHWNCGLKGCPQSQEWMCLSICSFTHLSSACVRTVVPCWAWCPGRRWVGLESARRTSLEPELIGHTSCLIEVLISARKWNENRCT